MNIRTKTELLMLTLMLSARSDRFNLHKLGLLTRYRTYMKTNIFSRRTNYIINKEKTADSQKKNLFRDLCSSQ